MNQHAHNCPDQPEQRRKRHDPGMIFHRRIHETGLATTKLIATAWSRSLLSALCSLTSALCSMPVRIGPTQLPVWERWRKQDYFYTGRHDRYRASLTITYRLTH